MSSADISIAATALAISLVAFFTALGQLLQQYFATADGYRRCQRSVMGEWASRTRLRWRWREFRFETLYTTPELFMTSTGPERPDRVVIDGSMESRVATLHRALESSSRGIRNANEMVCWVSLLNQLHLAGARNGASDTMGISLPALVFQERSWDFQVPDIVRPLAISCVSDVAIIARRLGMRWKDFRPYEGSLKAEGHFQVMTSTNVRSLGILLQYSYTWKEEWRPLFRFGMIQGSTKEKEDRYIPTTGADLLGFGIVSGNAGMHVPRFAIGTQEEIIASLNILEETGTCALRVRELIRQFPAYHLRTGDLVAMTMRMIRLRGRSHVQVPAPSENMHGFSTHANGRKAFRLCLAQCLAQGTYAMGPQTEFIYSACEKLSVKWKHWDSDTDDLSEGTEKYMRLMPEYLDAVHDLFDESRHKIATERGPIYRKVLGAHIRHAIFRDNGETTLLNAQTLRPPYAADVEAYFAAWPDILLDLSSGQKEYDAQTLFDTWVIMLFRACCWGACHIFVPGERVPSEYYGSQLPVYIG